MNISLDHLAIPASNPLLRNQVKVPLKDRIKFFYYGFWYGCSLQFIYLDYRERRRR